MPNIHLGIYIYMFVYTDTTAFYQKSYQHCWFNTLILTPSASTLSISISVYLIACIRVHNHFIWHFHLSHNIGWKWIVRTLYALDVGQIEEKHWKERNQHRAKWQRRGNVRWAKEKRAKRVLLVTMKQCLDIRYSEMWTLSLCRLSHHRINIFLFTLKTDAIWQISTFRERQSDFENLPYL